MIMRMVRSAAPIFFFIIQVLMFPKKDTKKYRRLEDERLTYSNLLSCRQSGFIKTIRLRAHPNSAQADKEPYKLILNYKPSSFLFIALIVGDINPDRDL